MFKAAGKASHVHTPLWSINPTDIRASYLLKSIARERQMYCVYAEKHKSDLIQHLHNLYSVSSRAVFVILRFQLQEMSHSECVPKTAPPHQIMGFDLKATGPECGQFCGVPHPQLPHPPPFLNSLQPFASSRALLTMINRPKTNDLCGAGRH